MAKYYDKETVIAMFKVNVLSQKKFKDITDDQKEDLWRYFLIGLNEIRKITAKQAKSWRYPKKELKHLKN